MIKKEDKITINMSLNLNVHFKILDKSYMIHYSSFPYVK